MLGLTTRPVVIGPDPVGWRQADLDESPHSGRSVRLAYQAMQAQGPDARPVIVGPSR